MRALILNSGIGSRMGHLTLGHPKCMTEISGTETILSRQLRLISEAGIKEVVMTTGAFDSVLIDYCGSLCFPLHITFVKNLAYRETNYIYSIYCAREYLDDDIILMHGDLVFEKGVFDDIVSNGVSCMAVSQTLPLPEKDFKMVICDGKVRKVGVGFFDDAVAAWALYKLKKRDWHIWLSEIIAYCENGNVRCYAEDALNKVAEECEIMGLDVHNRLCAEIDNQEDLMAVSARLKEVESKEWKALQLAHCKAVVNREQDIPKEKTGQKILHGMEEIGEIISDRKILLVRGRGGTLNAWKSINFLVNFPMWSSAASRPIHCMSRCVWA